MKIIKILLFATLLLLFSSSFFSLTACRASTAGGSAEGTIPEEAGPAEEDKAKKEEIGEAVADEGQEEPKENEASFGDYIKAPHWTSNIPGTNTIVPGVPASIAIGFNFDLSEGSGIKVESEGVQYSIGTGTIDDNNLVLRVGMEPESPDGLYDVSYTACWPDGSCHDGNFQFFVDSTLAGDFTDLKGKEEVTINMKDISFDPPDIIIDKGTTITWINQDAVSHTVNTDPHPGHYYYPEQNSGLLSNGDSFSVTFNKPGFYPYHCSPHASTMKGSIIVK